MAEIKQDYIKYKGVGEHSVIELEKIIEQREEELHLVRSQKPINVTGVTLRIKYSEKLEKGDVFLWSSSKGELEIHEFHSDAGYGIKTFTNFNIKDGSSLIVNHSGVRAIIQIFPKQSERVRIHPEELIGSIDWKELRNRYFKECTLKQNEQSLPKIDFAPHDLFEWFKRNIPSFERKFITDKEINIKFPYDEMEAFLKGVPISKDGIEIYNKRLAAKWGASHEYKKEERLANGDSIPRCFATIDGEKECEIQCGNCKAAQ